VTPKKPEDSEAEFARLAEAVSKDPRVDPPDSARAKGFGSKGLKVARKLFAFHSKGRLVVKLPADRVGALVSDSSYSDAFTEVQEVLPQEGGVPGWFTPGVFLMTRIAPRAGSSSSAARFSSA